MDVWEALVGALASLPPESLVSPEERRLGAVLVLLSDPGDGDLEVVYTRRREDLSIHPGQISFPGGRVDPGETVEEAALREAAEEVALHPASVEILGRLPACYIPPSRFWLQPLVARWHAPHPLAAAEAEVAEVLRVRLSVLREDTAWRTVQLSSAAHAWAWQLDDRNLLWGATALVTAQLLDMAHPGWHGGADPATLPPDREVRPWEAPARGVAAGDRPRLAGMVERPLRTVRAAANGQARPSPRALARAGEAVATAVGAQHGAPAGWGSVAVLVGPGGNGAVGLHAARRMRDRGLDVTVVLARPPHRLRPVAAEALHAVADRAVVFHGVVPEADVVVDALVGTGLSGPLQGSPHAVVMALRHHHAPVVSVDLPSGLHPVAGLIGDCVPADVTIALRTPRPGLLHPGLASLVGDLYLAGLESDGEVLVRLVADPPMGRWRA